MTSLFITLIMISGLMIASRQRAAKVCLFLLSLTAVAYFLLPALYFYYVPDSSLKYSVLFREHLTATLHMSSLFYGISASVAFLLFRFCRPIAAIGGRAGHATQVVSIVFLVASMTANLYLIRHGMFRLEGADHIRAQAPSFIRTLSNIHLLAFYLLLAQYACDRMGAARSSLSHSSFRFLSVSILFYSIALPLFQARRAGVILPIVLLIVIAYAYRQIKLRSVLLGGLSVVLLFSLVTAARTSHITGDELNLSLDNDPQHSRGIGVVLEADSMQRVVGRFATPLTSLNRAIFYRDILGQDPEFSTISHTLESLVPSALHPNKPAVSIANQFGREVDAISQDNFTTGINPGWIGESYYDGGYAGITMAAFVFGVLISLPIMLFPRRSTMSVIALIYVALLIVSGLQMEIAFSINSMLKGMGLIWLVTFLSKRRYRHMKHQRQAAG